MRVTIFRVAVIGFAILLISATLEDCGIQRTDNGPPEPMCANSDKDGDGFSFIPACGSTVDCDDNDPDNWISCDTCGDLDQDLFFAGCDDYTLVPGPDCNDQDIDNWISCDTCDDSDGDLFFTGCDDYSVLIGPDCDDGDSLVYPGAPEACDGIDNQCPDEAGFGEVDEGCVICTDEDGDGFCAESDYGPDQDCDDYEYYVNPGMLEAPCDGTDSDCDGMDYDWSLGCICYTLYDPVCGVDGITYGNDCEAMCAGCVPIDCYGECPCGGGIPFCDPLAYCITLWDPVCGMDGVTYGNDCEALNWGCTGIACYGMCPCW